MKQTSGISMFEAAAEEGVVCRGHPGVPAMPTLDTALA